MKQASSDQPIDHRAGTLLLQVLRKALSDDQTGQDVLRHFEKTPEVYSQALGDYLQSRFDQEKVFKEKLAGAQELPADIRAIIYGGNVERLIQIAKVGTLNQGPPWSVLLTAVVISVISVGALVLSVMPKSLPPMGGGFNVAVAEFAMVSLDGNTNSSDISRQFSEGLFNTIQNETKLLPTALGLELRGPKDVGVVTDDETARTTAKRLNATLLIYGRIKGDIHGSYQIEPRFFISDSTFSYGSEVTGPDYLGKPITQLRVGPDQQFLFNTKLNARTQALQRIVRGLAYFSIRDYESAAAEFQDAVNTPYWEPNEGQEVAYLLLGAARLRPWDLIQNLETLPKAEEAFNKAYELNPGNVRTYLGLGAVAIAQAQIPNASGTGIGAVYRDKLEEGIQWYSACLNQIEPRQAYIPTKAAFGLGQAYLLGYQYHVIDGSKELTLKYFHQVIQEYQNEPVPDIVWFAAHAHGGLGQLQSLDKNWTGMENDYREAIEILESMQPNPPRLWIARYWSYVAFAEDKQKHPEMAQDAYERAIEIGSSIVGTKELRDWQEKLNQAKQVQP